MIRVFPRRTKWTPIDELAFVGDPPLFRPKGDSVYISVTFTWDIKEGLRLVRAWQQYYKSVTIGGPALDTFAGFFIPGRFLKAGVTITSRGCPKQCSWCFVPSREGSIKELPIMDGWIVQDNNLLACSNDHIKKVFEMLERQPKAIKFSGGLDPWRFTQWHVRLMEKIKLAELWFSCDSKYAFRSLNKIKDLTADFPLNKKRCYVLIGFNNESIAGAEKRLNKVYEMGFLPFSQLYQGREKKRYSIEWRKLNRKWSRPAAYKSGTTSEKAP